MASPELVAALRSARDLIDRRFAEALDLDAMAAHAGYSRYYFARSFRAAFGETPRDYLSRRRIERAAELLRNANLTVTEVCMLVGFSSLGSFSSRFAALLGCAPAEYRRRNASGPPIPGCIVLAWSRPRPGREDRGGTREEGKPQGGTREDGRPQEGKRGEA